MPKFSQWVRNKFSGFRKVKDDSKVSKDAQLPCIPVLPQQRQYILTPTPSSENLVQNSNTKIAFFAKLPPELRQQIYIAAFGGRTIHIDLRFDHPETPGPAHARLDPERQRDRTVLPAWIWWSSVCHRNPVFEACEDQCRGGSLPHTACFLYPGNMPEKCFIGVMGWLLTCRQA